MTRTHFPANARFGCAIRAAVLLVGLGLSTACGKRGDPLPPLDRTPTPITDLRVAQRGSSVEVRMAAPRTTADGERLPLLEVELWRADIDGVDVREAKRVKVAPGEQIVETEPLPAPGVTLRYAARARLGRDLSPFTKVVALTVQEPPTAPEDLQAELTATGVLLSWTPPPLPEWLTAPPEAAPLEAAPPEAAPLEAASEAAPPEATPPEAEMPAAETEQPVREQAGADQETTLGLTAERAAAAEMEETGPLELEDADSGGEPEAAPEPTPEPTPEPFRGGVNVYRRSPFTVHGEPLTPTPVSEDHHLDTSAPIGTEACYVLRTVISTDPLVESEATDELCLEVRDIVAPAPPLGVAAVETEAGIEVSWSPSQEPDLVSYRVYRAERGGPSEPIGEAPSSASLFLDATPRGGAVFVYTVTAVDTAGNESAASDPAQVRLP